MNLSSNVGVFYPLYQVHLLKELHRDRISLVSELPKDVVNLIGLYICSGSFKKISRETPCMRSIRIAYCAGGSSAHRQAAKIAKHYNSTQININGLSTRIRIFRSDVIYTDRSFGPMSEKKVHANVYFLEPSQTITKVRSLVLDPTILAWNRMDLHKEQQEKLKKLPQKFPVVEYEGNLDYLMLKVIENVAIKYGKSFFNREEPPSTARREEMTPSAARALRRELGPPQYCCPVQ